MTASVEASVKPGASPGRRILRNLASGAAPALAFFLLMTLVGFLDQWTLLFELASQLRLQLFVLAAVSLPLVAFLPRLRLLFGSIGLAVVLINAYLLAPFWFGTHNSGGGAPLRVMSINLNAINPDTAGVLAAVREENPDLLALQEVTGRWVAELAPLENEYPHRFIETRPDCFGIALYSKLPLTGREVLVLGQARVPTLQVIAEKNGQPFTLIVTHPLPPANERGQRWRNEQLELLAEQLARTKGPLIVVGDLNATPWSGIYRRFVRATNLANARTGLGLHPTWPARLPWPARIPIDHILISPGVRAVAFRTGPFVTSDHLPVSADLQLPAVVPESD